MANNWLYHGTDDLTLESIKKRGLCATDLCQKNFEDCQHAIYVSPLITVADTFAGISVSHKIQGMGITDPGAYANEHLKRKKVILRFKKENSPPECTVWRDPRYLYSFKVKKCECIPIEALEICEIDYVSKEGVVEPETAYDKLADECKFKPLKTMEA